MILHYKLTITLPDDLADDYHDIPEAVEELLNDDIFMIGGTTVPTEDGLPHIASAIRSEATVTVKRTKR